MAVVTVYNTSISFIHVYKLTASCSSVASAAFAAVGCCLQNAKYSVGPVCPVKYDFSTVRLLRHCLGALTLFRGELRMYVL